MYFILNLFNNLEQSVSGYVAPITRKLRIDRDTTSGKIQGELRRFERRLQTF
jgi:hypothetical protein